MPTPSPWQRASDVLERASWPLADALEDHLGRATATTPRDFGPPTLRRATSRRRQGRRVAYRLFQSAWPATRRLPLPRRLQPTHPP
jgi:hypothetical protein